MRKIINLLLFFAFQFCYMEWPPNNSMFVFQAEYEIFSKTESLISNIIHPIILLGLIAQIILLMGAFLPKFYKKLNTIGIIILGFLVLLFLLISILSTNIRMLLATLPYLLLCVFYFWNLKKLT